MNHTVTGQVDQPEAKHWFERSKLSTTVIIDNGEQCSKRRQHNFSAHLCNYTKISSNGSLLATHFASSQSGSLSSPMSIWSKVNSVLLNQRCRNRLCSSSRPRPLSLPAQSVCSEHDTFSFLLCQPPQQRTRLRLNFRDTRKQFKSNLVYLCCKALLLSTLLCALCHLPIANAERETAWRHQPLSASSSTSTSLSSHLSSSPSSSLPIQNNALQKKPKGSRTYGLPPSAHHLSSYATSYSLGQTSRSTAQRRQVPSETITGYSPYLNVNNQFMPFSQYYQMLPFHQHQMLPHHSAYTASSSRLELSPSQALSPISHQPLQLQSASTPINKKRGLDTGLNTSNNNQNSKYQMPVMHKSRKGGPWWNLAGSTSVGLDPTLLHMDGRHANAIVPYSSSSSSSSASSVNINLPLRKKQRKLIRDNPGLLLAISKAMQLAINECQHQFKDRRWNCPVNDWKKGKNIFGRIVQTGCRETAFVYALTSAAVAHSIARACAEGRIDTCTCDYTTNRMESGTDWEWGGCSDNIKFGYKFARSFVDAAEHARDHRFVMNLHNNEAGRQQVSHEMRRECKCHGMSGSCTVKTCWMRLAPFREIGNTLKERFDAASRVRISNGFRGHSRKYKYKSVPLEPYESGYRAPTSTDLIYFEESPDFCVSNPKYGVSGTQGRLCNASSIGVEGCGLLCCGRGYITEEKEVVERCNCTFKWCCQVECQVCNIKKQIHRCK